MTLLRKTKTLLGAITYSIIYLLGPPIFMMGYISWTGLIWFVVQLLIIIIYIWALLKAFKLNGAEWRNILFEFGIVIIASVLLWLLGTWMLQNVY